MGETRVDLLHLLEDLRDAYPGSVEETILTEIVANSLDSGASALSLLADPAQASFTVLDNGSGMKRRELARFHDLAASTKIRGQGIGFAGVGIKLGLLVCEDVLTETRRGKTHVASVWHMASRHRAPWKWTAPLGLVPERGTGVRLRLRNPLSPLLDPGFVEEILRRHFQPLLDPAFDDFLAPHYPSGVCISINGSALARQPAHGGLKAPLEIRLLRRRKPSALGYLTRADQPLPEEQRGLSISTYGKVIRRGWDWLGLTPAAPDHIGGLIEVPELAACLTLNKGDFIRTGTRGATYLSFRKVIQQALAKQLAEWGDAPAASDQAPPREVRPLQRDLIHLLEDLAEDFPLLASLVEQRAGGQKRLAFGAKQYAAGRELIAAAVADAAEGDESNSGNGSAGGDREGLNGNPVVSDGPEPAQISAGASIRVPGETSHKRPGHYGLDIRFEDRPEDVNLARLVESTVWVNRAHPAYHRAMVSRSIGYHIALAVAMSLAPLAVEPAQQSRFLLTFLTRWGEAVEKPSARRSVRHS
jgi:hypothetical protein